MVESMDADMDVDVNAGVNVDATGDTLAANVAFACRAFEATMTFSRSWTGRSQDRPAPVLAALIQRSASLVTPMRHLD